ncbi:uncharacterized protein [Oryctolagus cuniculus]|uniref:uncharacterized protein isoform X2 n=1 Tax=Oryctolagus cuniculus TaxID=9986 RepID=UPI00387A31D4
MAAPRRTGRASRSPCALPARFHLRRLPRLPSHPLRPSSASRVLPGSGRNCSWRSRGTPKAANERRRDAEIGTKDGKEMLLSRIPLEAVSLSVHHKRNRVISMCSGVCDVNFDYLVKVLYPLKVKEDWDILSHDYCTPPPLAHLLASLEQCPCEEVLHHFLPCLVFQDTWLRHHLTCCKDDFTGIFSYQKRKSAGAGAVA